MGRQKRCNTDFEPIRSCVRREPERTGEHFSQQPAAVLNIPRQQRAPALHVVLHARLDRPSDAIAHYEAATRLQPKEAEFCDNLAAAYVAAGRIEQAVATATRAVELAHNAGQDDLASDAARRLALYRRMLARKAEAAADGMQAGRTPAARRQRKSADDGSLPQRSR